MEKAASRLPRKSCHVPKETMKRTKTVMMIAGSLFIVRWYTRTGQNVYRLLKNNCLAGAASLLSRLILSVALATLPAQALLASEPAPAGLEEVQTFPSEGRSHLDPGEKWDYSHYPPTSGPHDPVPVKPGFYGKPQAPEKLVHSLEHGNIVIYYDNPPEPVLRQLEKWAREYTGKWDGVVVTPLPGLGKGVMLTAWTKLLRLDPFDPAKASAFMEAFRGKGPEHGQNEM